MTMPHRVAVIGTGYVGTVAAACLAYIGHDVIAVESDSAKLNVLLSGRAPFFEPGLDSLIRDGLASGRLQFTSDFALGMDRSDVVFICVGTPSASDGTPDLSAVRAVTRSIALNLRHRHIIVVKSTVPVGTARWLLSLLEVESPASIPSHYVAIASNPEFLREGNSVHDFLHPDRVILGVDDPQTLEVLSDLYRPIFEQSFPDQPSLAQSVPFIVTSLAAAELTKYVSNAFLATKISFANEIARICDMVGADISEVTAGMGLDPRIGPRFLDAGLGWGGSCFPKDILALIRTASEYGYTPRVLAAALAVNAEQPKIVLDALQRHLKLLRGARIGVLGIAFKPGTDDPRDSAALELVRLLQTHDVTVVAHDPMIKSAPGITTVTDPYEVADGADAIVLATDWPEYLGLDLGKLRRRSRGNFFFDGRNLLNPAAIRQAGFHYEGIGRSASPPTSSARTLSLSAPDSYFVTEP